MILLLTSLTMEAIRKGLLQTLSIHTWTQVCYICCIWCVCVCTYICMCVPMWVCTSISIHSLPSCLMLWMNCLRLILCLFTDIALEFLSHSDQFSLPLWIIPNNEETSWQVFHFKKSSLDPASVFSYHPIYPFPLIIRLLEQLVCIALSKSFSSILC